jgi:alkylation response protein AidB-like acyl-CoA dehydrogenase
MYIDIVDDVDIAIESLSRAFAETAALHDAKASFPFDNIERLRTVGAPAFVVPTQFGGRGFGLSRAQSVVNRIAKGEASTGLVLAQQYLFHGSMLRNPGFPKALRNRILRSAVDEGGFVNSLRVEPDLGTPARGGLPATIARRAASGWVLNGRKIYSTGCPVLRWNAIWARTDEAEPRIGVFVVPGGAPGLRIEETWRQMGMRASGSHDVVLENVEIPEDHAAELGSPEQRARPDPVLTAWVSVLFATVYDGAARAARDWIVSFLKTRAPTNLGAPLASLPRMQEAVGEIDSALYASRILLQDLSERVDRGDTPAPQQSLYVKHNVNANSLKAVSKALEIAGNPGLAQDNSLERHYRDVLCARVHTPQADTILIGGGREALGAL